MSGVLLSESKLKRFRSVWGIQSTTEYSEEAIRADILNILEGPYCRAGYKQIHSILINDYGRYESVPARSCCRIVALSQSALASNEELFKICSNAWTRRASRFVLTFAWGAAPVSSSVDACF